MSTSGQQRSVDAACAARPGRDPADRTEARGAPVFTMPRWRELQRQLANLAPSKAPPPPPGKFRHGLYTIVMDKRGKFARFVIGVMICHTLLICTTFYQQNAIVPWFFYVQGGTRESQPVRTHHSPMEQGCVRGLLCRGSVAAVLSRLHDRDHHESDCPRRARGTCPFLPSQPHARLALIKAALWLAWAGVRVWARRGCGRGGGAGVGGVGPWRDGVATYQFFRLFWNIYDATVVSSAILATTVQIVLTIAGNQNYALLQIEKVCVRARMHVSTRPRGLIGGRIVSRWAVCRRRRWCC